MSASNLIDGALQTDGRTTHDHRHACSEPRAYATLEISRYSWIWVVPRCPYCGRAHEHYGGAFTDNPYQYTGHLVPARCDRRADRPATAADVAHTYRLMPLPPPTPRPFPQPSSTSGEVF
jgi:hypothetical protein